MDVSPFLGALHKTYRVRKFHEGGLLTLYECRPHRLFSSPFYVGFADCFYLPETEHRLRSEVAAVPFPRTFNRVLILVSYNGMTQTPSDDLSSVTDRALIQYILFERDTNLLYSARGFTPQDRIPEQVRGLFTRALAEDVRQSTLSC